MCMHIVEDALLYLHYSSAIMNFPRGTQMDLIQCEHDMWQTWRRHWTFVSCKPYVLAKSIAHAHTGRTPSITPKPTYFIIAPHQLSSNIIRWQLQRTSCDTWYYMTSHECRSKQQCCTDSTPHQNHMFNEMCSWWTLQQENGRTVRLCPLLWKTIIIVVHFAHANPWLFTIPNLSWILCTFFSNAGQGFWYHPKFLE